MDRILTKDTFEQSLGRLKRHW